MFTSATASILSTALLGIPIVGPFLGSLVGQWVGATLGNSIFDRDDIASSYITLNPETEALTIVGVAQGGGLLAVSDTMARKAMNDVNGFLAALGTRPDPNGSFAPVGFGYFMDSANQKRVWA